METATENTVESRKDHPGRPTKPAYLDYTHVDGNAFSIMGQVSQALRNAGATKEYIDLVLEDCMAGNYDRLLSIAMAEVKYEQPGVVYDEFLWDAEQILGSDYAFIDLAALRTAVVGLHVNETFGGIEKADVLALIDAIGGSE